MPDHWKEIVANAPLAAIGMVIGKVDAFIESLPVTIKILMAVFAVLGPASVGYFDMRQGLAIVSNNISHCQEMHTNLQHDLERIEDRLYRKP